MHAALHTDACAAPPGSPSLLAPCARPPSRCCRQSRRRPRPRRLPARTPRLPSTDCQCSHQSPKGQRLGAPLCRPRAPSDCQQPPARRSGPSAPSPSTLPAESARWLRLQGRGEGHGVAGQEPASVRPACLATGCRSLRQGDIMHVLTLTPSCTQLRLAGPTALRG